MSDKLKSRKLWAFVAATILVLVNSIAKLGMPTEDVFYLVIVSASYILGQGYVDAKRQNVKEFPIEDIAQSFANIVQTEFSKTSFGKEIPIGSILDIVKTLIKQELVNLSVFQNREQPGSSSAEPSATPDQSS